MKTWMRPIWISGSVVALTMALVPGGLAQNEVGRSPASPRATGEPGLRLDLDAQGTPISDAGAGRVPAAFMVPTGASMGAKATQGATVAVTSTPAAPALGHPVDPAVSALESSSPRDTRPPSKTGLSPWATEIVKLAQAGIEDKVMLSFIDNTPGTFNLGADQIIYLKNLGVSSRLITVMMDHDLEVASGLRLVTASTVPAAQTAVKIALVPLGDPTGKDSKQLATAPTFAAAVNRALAEIPDGTSAAEVEPDLSFSETPESDYAMADRTAPDSPSAKGLQGQNPMERQKLYPVREPYAVELTAPIIVVRAWGRTPNTLLIELSP